VEPAADADAAPVEPVHLLLTCPRCKQRFGAVVERSRAEDTELRCPYCMQSIGVRLGGTAPRPAGNA